MALRIFDQQTQARVAASIDQQQAAQTEFVAHVAALLAGHQRESVFAELVDSMMATPDHACTVAATAILTLAEAVDRG
jgi:hypothetical protein